MDINNVAELSVDFEELLELKKEKILLNPIGTLPKYSQQNIDLGLPIAIMDYQYDLVKDYRRSKKINSDRNYEQEQISNFSPSKWIYPQNFAKDDNIYKQVYHDLVVNYGYYVQQGSKYGCDFVLYEDDPDTCHSSFLLNIIDHTEKKQTLTVRELVLWQRVSNKVNKKTIIAFLAQEEKKDQGDKNLQIKYVCLDNFISDLKVIK
ncbi:tRNA intron endonuclease catalytic C-terminal domain protein [Cryptosporidium meleagridis]|uniref:tRNA-intron lyase n=1 Tax=Cryptosporidium meleagridis TaxID=93969 RepID=A0A2P4Z507_9CRYT|nr:tRNA intron endonuclease catalytic C-terminal domain protein [Cryptosporidium meleagridis]